MASMSSAMANGSDGGGCGLLFLAAAASCTFWFPLFLNHSISKHAVVHHRLLWRVRAPGETGSAAAAETK